MNQILKIKYFKYIKNLLKIQEELNKKELEFNITLEKLKNEKKQIEKDRDDAIKLKNDYLQRVLINNFS